MTATYYKPKENELDDDAVMDVLKKLPGMYENGELVEVQKLIEDIWVSIEQFSMAQNGG